MFRSLVIILRMIRFSHTVFALPFAIMAAFLAANGANGGFCGWDKLFLIILCMVFARSVAMTFNRIVDAEIDARNPRTAERPIPAGYITKQKAWLFLLVCAVLFVASTSLFWKPIGYPFTQSQANNLNSTGWPWFGYGNYWPLFLAAPVLMFICLYSYTKRFTWASHFWLGASLMLAPVGTWIAVSPPTGPVISASALVLALAVLLWVAGFDIIYACRDIDFDRRQKLYSIPAKLGIPTALWLSRICHSLTITALLLLTLTAQLGSIYLTAVAFTAALLIGEHLLVIRGRMKLAFDLNGIVGILIAAATICDIMTRIR